MELWGEVPHAYPDWVDRKLLKDTLSAYNMVVTMHAPFSGLDPAWPFQPVRGAVQKTLEDFVKFSDMLGASIITFHPGSVYNKALVAHSLTDSIETFRMMVKAADGRIGINAENQAKSRSPYEFPVVSTVGSIFGVLDGVEGTNFTMDSGHAHVSGIDPETLAKKLGKKLVEIHLSDNAGESDDHLIPGRGTAKLSGLLDLLPSSNVLVCLELNPFKYTKGEVIAAALEVKKALLRS